ncbi:MAG: asparaginase [Clostridia bacterium]|nr:asparaginase [Clostridia bacterium]
MKEILIIHTGGTIGSFPQENAREMNKKTAAKTRRLLIENFAKSKSKFAKYNSMLSPGDYPWQNTTLSESMTLKKLSELIKYIGSLNLSLYDGLIILHGTDTLAYTASLLSFAFAKTEIPIFLVSGNRPPHDKLSNANANFTTAIELIWSGIAPNVYVTYRNTDNIMRLYLASSIMQSENYSDNFRSPNGKSFILSNEKQKNTALKKCLEFSQKRVDFAPINPQNITALSQKVLLIKPYTGLDYSVYDGCFNTIEHFKAVVHGTYHSGTVSYPGLVLKAEAEEFRKQGKLEEAKKLEALSEKEALSKYSVRYLTDLCKQKSVPVFIAPSFLGSDQYETMNAVCDNTHAKLLNMTTESAYAKLILALSCSLTNEQITEYMQLEINNEFT